MLRAMLKSAITIGLLGAMVVTAGAETLDQFRERVKAAYTAGNRHAALSGLFYRTGMDEFLLSMYENRTIPMLARRSPQTITFEGLPADFRSVYVQEGYEYRPNLTPLGYLVLDGKTRVPYGEVDGRFYITGMSRKLVKADPPDERTVQVNVYGFSTPPIRYQGSCEILQSNGKTVTMEIEDTGLGNNTMAMNAVRIESCRVTKLSGDGPLTMRVLEADETLFEQQITDAGASLVYNR